MSRAAVKPYTRIAPTEDGGSAFEDDLLHLDEQVVADGVPSMFVGDLRPTSRVVFLRSTEFDSAPHPAPRRQWVIPLRGTIEIEVSNGSRRRFEPGDLLFVADTTGSGHSTLAVGEPPLEALFVPEA
jgi:hypothetical protein